MVRIIPSNFEQCMQPIEDMRMSCGRPMPYAAIAPQIERLKAQLGEIEAVIRGYAEGVYCEEEFVQAQAIQREIMLQIRQLKAQL